MLHVIWYTNMAIGDYELRWCKRFADKLVCFVHKWEVLCCKKVDLHGNKKLFGEVCTKSNVFRWESLEKYVEGSNRCYPLNLGSLCTSPHEVQNHINSKRNPSLWTSHTIQVTPSNNVEGGFVRWINIYCHPSDSVNIEDKKEQQLLTKERMVE
jgi:hypothetical protein